MPGVVRRSPKENWLIAPEGFPFIAVASILAAIAGVAWSTLGWISGLLVVGFVVAFFRNPRRYPADDSSLIVAPADGRVISVIEAEDPHFGLGRCKRISIFLSIFNVHVNRSPLNGDVEQVKYLPGRFHFANVDKASLDNEQNAMLLRGSDGRRISVVQIAGWVARRIVCDVAAGASVTKGQRLGLIRFGSRVDIYLPDGGDILVQPGDKTRTVRTAIIKLS